MHDPHNFGPFLSQDCLLCGKQVVLVCVGGDGIVDSEAAFIVEQESGERPLPRWLVKSGEDSGAERRSRRRA